MDTDAIKVVAALIRDDAGRVLLVRKRGTSRVASAIPVKTTSRRSRAKSRRSLVVVWSATRSCPSASSMRSQPMSPAVG
jgi:hypothetical protein